MLSFWYHSTNTIYTAPIFHPMPLFNASPKHKPNVIFYYRFIKCFLGIFLFLLNPQSTIIYTLYYPTISTPFPPMAVISLSNPQNSNISNPPPSLPEIEINSLPYMLHKTLRPRMPPKPSSHYSNIALRVAELG